ncbi:MAG: Hsp20/alpha crystallin family protein [Betaproteobacteria bacterium]|nr:Hsp20/alpha crystallin family protein [Betaproteobacteria bacterium]MDH5286950.1 Hsp20/alpha crystallin family protein [Betaproteobacteria bacterium]
MKAMTRWNPFREMLRYDPFTDVAPLWKEFAMGAMPEPEPTMKMDVAETASGYVVKAELPGVAKEDVNVSVDGNTVSITAEVKREKEEKEGEKVLRSERYFGSVSRSMTMPDDIDLNRADAKFENGVLTLTLPKSPGGESRKLPVH